MLLSPIIVFISTKPLRLQDGHQGNDLIDASGQLIIFDCLSSKR